MVEFLSFFIDFFKLYLVIFYFFGYVPKKSVRKPVLFTGLVIALLSRFGYYNLLLGKYSDTLTAILIILIITYALSSLKKVGITLVFALAMTFIDTIIAFIVYSIFLKKNIHLILLNNLTSVIVNSISLVILLGIFGIKERKFNKLTNYQFDLSKTEVAILLMGITGGTFLLALYATIDFDANIHLAKNFLLTSVIIIFILLLNIIILFYKDRKNKMITQFEQRLNRQQKHYNLQLLDKYMQKRKFNHDVQNHLLCISELVRKEKYEELKEYVADIKADYKETRLAINTNNYLVDVIINDLISNYEQEKIEIIWKGKFHADLKMKEIDISSLFSNLLRNAFEATVQTKEIEKFIQINIKYSGRNMVIQIINPFQESNFQNKQIGFTTTKLNKEEHGFGNSIIQSIVKKYNGKIKYHVADNIFMIEILFSNLFN
ncbi:sensor histidine kinase [Enterococcus ratti]|uniref:Sensor histidine kinase NatK-like C-terminal domain-containing protein n=1 Tax=Enterococcus ratti TaxID=150033 RepID=A0A1L8WRP7_9ENTE|nr:GHKL domain-containing protein [Enterococcus ratti]OJG83695.1 hypothetical protein RV14_GL000929 [Enterococcus ratti]